MGVKVEVVPARRFHCGRVARHLRWDHKTSLAHVGVGQVHAAIRKTFDESTLCQAWYFDERFAGMAGVTGSILSPVGFVWLAMTEHGANYPLTVVREARKFLDRAMSAKAELHTTVLGDDEAGMRLAAFLGFHASHSGPGARAMSRFGRRTLVDYLKNSPENRILAGNGYAVRMGYHQEA